MSMHLSHIFRRYLLLGAWEMLSSGVLFPILQYNAQAQDKSKKGFVLTPYGWRSAAEVGVFGDPRMLFEPSKITLCIRFFFGQLPGELFGQQRLQISQKKHTKVSTADGRIATSQVQ